MSTIKVPVLSPAQEDVIISSRLFNDERPLRRTVKKIVALQAPQPPEASAPARAEGDDVDMAAAPTDAGAGEQAGPSTTKADSIELNAEKQRQVAEDVWDGFRLQLRDTEFLVKKAGVVSRMEEKMRAEYDAKGTEIDASQSELRAEVSSLRHKLALAEEERKHKMEYDQIALRILAVGSRSSLEADISGLADRVSTLQAEQSTLASSLLARKSRFDTLLEELESIRKVGTEQEAAPQAEEDEPKLESIEPSRVGSPAAEDADGKDDDDEDEEADGRREVKKVSPKKKAAIVEPEPELDTVEDDGADGLADGGLADSATAAEADVDMQAADELEAEGMVTSAKEAQPSVAADANLSPLPNPLDADSPLSSLLTSQFSEAEESLVPKSEPKRKASQSPTASGSSSAQRSRRTSPSGTAVNSPANLASPTAEDPTEGMSRTERSKYLAQVKSDAAAASSDAPSAPSSSSNKRQRLSESPAPPPAGRAKRVSRRGSATPAAEDAGSTSPAKGKGAKPVGPKAKALASVKGGAGKKGKAAVAKADADVEEGEDSDLTDGEDE